MHLVGPWLSTTATRKRAEKLTKAQQEELERAWRGRNKWLANLHMPKESFEQYLDWIYGRGKKEKREAIPRTQASKTNTGLHKGGQEKVNISRNKYNSTDTSDDAMAVAGTTHGKIWVTGACSSKPSPKYTGTKILGIGTMHKSNMVPIFSDDEAKEISNMRR